jgi:hypothetical protein
VRAAAAILAAALTVTALAGCSPQADPAPTPTATASSSTSATPPTETPSPDGLDDGIDTPVAPTADETTTAAAVTVAEKLMTAFAQPNIDATSWINGLYPYLTQGAGVAYAGTDPAKVPVSQVTGAGTVVEGSTDYALLVKVPTNIGEYVVSLTRKSPTDPWLADRVTPPTR